MRTSLNPLNHGAKDDFLSEASTFLSKETLENYIDVKTAGATFGSLTEKELTMLQAAATKINALAIRNANGELTGFKGTEAVFRAEMDRLINLTELNLQREREKLK